MDRVRLTIGRLSLVALFLLAWIPLAAAADDAAPTMEGPEANPPTELAREGFVKLAKGEVETAAKLLGEVTARGSADPEIGQALEWVKEYRQLTEERSERIEEDYEKYVSWVKEEMEKGLWRQVIRSCSLAYNNSWDPEAFRQEPWLQDAAKGVVDKAEEYEQEREWLKAAGMYARLSDIFPQNEEYRDALKRCQAHIRLELTYAPDVNGEDGEDSEAPDEDEGTESPSYDENYEPDWEAVVQYIVPRMARDAFRKIDAEYLREVDFREMAISAMEQMLRMAREPKLTVAFERLEDKEAVEEFCSRVQIRLDYARKSDELNVHDLIAYLNRVWTINEETGLFPQEVLIYEFVHGALQPLDRFTDMIWPSDVQEFEKNTQGRFSGVGIQIRKGFGEPIKVVTPLDDTPAYRAGIQPGDLITKVNGKDASRFSITGAVREITGPPGTTVRLTIHRIGVDKDFDVVLERQEITIFTIKGYERDQSGEWDFMIDKENRIGYARLTNFTEGSIDELRTVVEELEQEYGLRGLIFDLRGNPGGPLKSAIEVSDLFLDGNKKIVSTRDRDGKDWEMSSTNEAHFTNFPLILLVNGVSASASEIVTGALQEHGRALVVGERTFGKGSVQQVLRLNDDHPAFLKLTTALYYLPNGRCLHREEDSTVWGVDPDFEVKLMPKESIKVNELRLRRDILKGKDQEELTEEAIKSAMSYGDDDEADTQPVDGDESAGSEAAEEEASTTQPADADDEEAIQRTDPNEYPEIDPQLEAALMLMRVRLETKQPWPKYNPSEPEIAATSGHGAGS